MSYVQPAIHPDNKTAYQDGDRIEFTIDGRDPIYKGKIVGISASHLIDQWIIQPDERLPGWNFTCVTIPHPQIRREGSNVEFLCRYFNR